MKKAELRAKIHTAVDEALNHHIDDVSLEITEDEQLHCGCKYGGDDHIEPDDDNQGLMDYRQEFTDNSVHFKTLKIEIAYVVKE